MDPIKTSQPQESKLHFLDYWRIIRIRKTVILSVFLLVVITATVVTFILPPSFSSTTRIRVERNITDIPTVGSQQTYVQGSYDPYFIQTEFEVIQSAVILEPVIKQLNLAEEWGKKYQGGQRLTMTDALKMLRSSIDLSPVRNTSIIQITVYSDSAAEAAKIADAIAQEYKQHRLTQANEMLSSGIKALKTSLEAQQAEVTQAQSNVDWLRTDLKITDPNPGSTMPSPTLSVESVRAIESQRLQSQANLAKLESILTELQSLNIDQVVEAVSTAVGPDQELNYLVQQLDMAKDNVITMKRDYTAESPKLQNAEQLVSDLESRIKDRVNGIMKGLTARVNSERAALTSVENELVSAKSNDLYNATVSRPYYAAKQALAEKQQFKAILAMKIASETTDLALPRNAMVEIIEPAAENPRAVSPKKALNIVLGVVIGLVVGVGLAFFIEYLDTSVKTIDDVERTLQAPVLGVIPQNVGFLLEEGAESPHAEAYRVLRTNLLFSRKDENLNSVAVVSAGAGEGKSTTVMNLATVFAQNGSRVVVVDSDLRRPTLHKILGIANSIGLTNYLLKQNTLEEVIQTTKIPSLDFMASGKLPSSSLGILSSSKMGELINDLKQRYDFVFFDSPPIMGVSDASILASEVDMTLQVIQYRRYPQPMNIRAKQMIEKVSGNLLGIVLNNINMSQDESYYYYSGYYHDYYYKSDESQKPDEHADGDKAKPEIKQKF